MLTRIFKNSGRDPNIKLLKFLRRKFLTFKKFQNRGALLPFVLPGCLFQVFYNGQMLGAFFLALPALDAFGG